MTVRARRKARPDRHNDRRIRDARAQIFLCQNRVHKGVRLQFTHAVCLRVCEHRDPSALRERFRLSGVLREYRLHALDRRGAVADSLGKAHRPPDGRWLRQVGHDDFYARAKKPECDSCCNIARTADNDQHFHLSFSLLFHKYNVMIIEDARRNVKPFWTFSVNCAMIGAVECREEI